MEEVQRLKVDSAHPEPRLDAITRQAAEMLHTPIAMLSIVEQDHVWLRSHFGLDITQFKREGSLCEAVIQSDDVLEVADTRKHPIASNHPFVTGKPGVRFYAGAPLRTRHGYNIGSLCIMDVHPRALSDLDRDILRMLAQLAVDEMELRSVSASAGKPQDVSIETQLFAGGPTILFKWQAREEWPVEYVSPNISQFGYVPDDFTSGAIPYARIVHPEDLLRVSEEVRAYTEQNAPCFTQEYRILRKDGQACWVYDYTNVVRDESGRVTHYHGYLLDITARKQAEEALRESWAKYEAVIESFDGLVYICSADYKVEFMNRRLIERTGYNAVGEDCYKVLHQRDSICPWCVNESVLRGKTVRWEIQSPKDKRWYYVVNTPLRHADGSMSKMSMIQDITERKQAEDMLKRRETILEAIAFSSEQFMRQEGWQLVIRDVLARLGQATNVSRVYVFQNQPETGAPLRSSMRYEWTAPGVHARIYNPAVQNLSYEEAGFRRWADQLGHGSLIEGLVREFPESERRLLQDQGVVSVVAVPIFVDKVWWGFIGLDCCHNERTWMPIELDALKTAASLIGSAIHRTQSEEALRQSEERTRMILNAIPDMMFRMRRDGTFLDYKADRASDLAVPPDQIVGRRISEILPRELAEKTLYYIDRTLRTGERQVYEYELGTEREQGRYESRMVVSGPDEVLTIVRDITEKRQSQAELNKLSSAVEQTADSVVITDANGVIEYVNPAFERLSGYKAPEVVGQTPRVLKSGAHEAPFYEELWRKLRSGEVVQAEFVNKRKDGSLYYQGETIAPIKNAEGEVTHFVSTGRDITERKRAEEAIRKLAAFPQFNPNAVLELGADAQIIYFNHAAREMALGLGLREPAQMLPPNHPSIVAECTATGKNRSRIEVTVGKSTLTWSFFPIPETGTVHAYGVDISERLNLETQMRHLQRMEAVGRLAGGIAHDFNNILTAILGYSSMLLVDEQLSEEAGKQVQEIARAADRASQLTRHLLTFSRKQMIQPRALDLNQLLVGLGDMLRRLIREDITLSFDLKPEIPTVHGDASMLDQVVVNMVINARDAMPKGGTIVISTSVRDVETDDARRNPEARAGRFACFSVADSGCGIEDGVKAHIFEPFFTTKSEGRGTGLGLATAYGIVKQHNGWIDIDSEPNHGAVFTVYLPIHTGPERPRTERMNRSEIQRGTETVLLVEDEQAVRALAGSVLAAYGYRVIEAASGTEGLKVWEENRDKIDILLADVVMPGGLTGNELADKLRAAKPSLKVILTSGYSLDAVGEKIRAARPYRFLPKPFSPASLAKAIREALDGAE